MWGVTELKVNAKPHNKIEAFIQKIKEVVGSLNRDTVAKACNSFKPKIETVVTLTAISLNKLDLKMFLC